jgi:hypothetical protein
MSGRKVMPMVRTQYKQEYRNSKLSGCATRLLMSICVVVLAMQLIGLYLRTN